VRGRLIAAAVVAVVVTVAGAGGGAAILAGVAPLTAITGGVGALALAGAVAQTIRIVRNRGPPVGTVSPLAGRAAERNRITRVIIRVPLLTVPARSRPAAYVLVGAVTVTGALVALAAPTAALVATGAAAMAAVLLAGDVLRPLIARSRAARGGGGLGGLVGQEQPVARPGVLGVLTTARPALGLVTLAAWIGPGIAAALPVAGGVLLAATAVQVIARRGEAGLDTRADLVATTALGAGLAVAPAGAGAAVLVGVSIVVASAVVAGLRAGTRSEDAPVGRGRVVARAALLVGLTTYLVLGPGTPAAAVGGSGSVAGVGMSVGQWIGTPVGVTVAAVIGAGVVAVMLWRAGAKARARALQFVFRVTGLAVLGAIATGSLLVVGALAQVTVGVALLPASWGLQMTTWGTVLLASTGAIVVFDVALWVGRGVVSRRAEAREHLVAGHRWVVLERL
ncbi:hypothetical protein, partial [Pseudonocardia zijingensis]|uniref:hypothetical protein n=1 Tax=Pseudonocardia zijingensis TaxID=153376 RepID=UPI0031DF75CD